MMLSTIRSRSSFSSRRISSYAKYRHTELLSNVDLSPYGRPDYLSPPEDVMAGARELNFDGLVGPSHHFGGLSFGNVASSQHQGELSTPRRAALRGLEKTRLLQGLGVPRGFFPPHFRPELSLA